MTYPYRCCNCRARNTSARKVTSWTQPRCKAARYSHAEVTKELRRIGGMRCKNCGHTSFYLDKYRLERKPCTCSGGLIGRTGPIPHRPGSPCCALTPGFELARAERDGATDTDLCSIVDSMLRYGEPVPSKWRAYRERHAEEAIEA